MSKKIFVLALSLMATVLLAANCFGAATNCDSGINVHYVGIGSSAQFNTLAFGAIDGALAAEVGFQGPVNVWTSSKSEVVDDRVSLVDKGLKTWVVYDSNNSSNGGQPCNVYIGYQADSVQGVKDFFCWDKGSFPSDLTAACYGNHDAGQSGGSWETQAHGNAIPGVTDSDSTGLTTLPLAIQTFIVLKPSDKSGTKQTNPYGYCGQSNDTDKDYGTNTHYCYFNAAHTDIRPEDALYATTRALSSYNTTNSLSGLGYNNAACGATTKNSKPVGCPIYDSFAQSSVFFPLEFAITGADPYTAATPEQGYTTLSLGASPVVVFVNNTDTGTLGFGVGTPSNYLHKDINRKVLAHIFDGTDACTGDLLNTSGGAFGGSIQGAGQPVQAVIREPLSGTYNTFEFTGVRTFTGSGLTLGQTGTIVGQNGITTDTWVSDQESSQEADFYNNLGTAGPAFSFGINGCPANSNTAPTAGSVCGDPLFVPTGVIPGTSTANCPGTNSKVALHLRAIGTGQEVKAALATINTGGSQVEDGIGYAFWGYSNFKGGSKTCSGSATSGDVSCTTQVGHYLTVDAVDPLYPDEGGGAENLNGAYNFPQCGFIQGVAGYSFPCEQIPFTHIYDGKYPLWSLLRLVTFNNSSASAELSGSSTPEGVINLVAYAQAEAAPGSATQLSDFVPFLSSVSGLPYQPQQGWVNTNGTAVTWVGGTEFPSTLTGTITINSTAFTIASVNSNTSITLTASAGVQSGVYYTAGTATLPKGNLNLGVFRSHYLQSAIHPDNGHKGCAPGFNFTAVNITGGTAGHPTCLVDVGGDVGGSVLTVQSDVDFYTDFHGVTVSGRHYPSEIVNLRQ